MELDEKIEKQVNAGFTKEQIVENLLGEGHSKEEIESQLKAIPIEINASKGTSTKNILLGFLFLIVVVWRISRYTHYGSTLALISIFSGLLLAILYFTKTS
jgi:hypothetical protein